MLLRIAVLLFVVLSFAECKTQILIGTPNSVIEIPLADDLSYQFETDILVNEVVSAIALDEQNGKWWIATETGKLFSLTDQDESTLSEEHMFTPHARDLLVHQVTGELWAVLNNSSLVKWDGISETALGSSIEFVVQDPDSTDVWLVSGGSIVLADASANPITAIILTGGPTVLGAAPPIDSSFEMLLAVSNSGTSFVHIDSNGDSTVVESNSLAVLEGLVSDGTTALALFDDGGTSVVQQFTTTSSLSEELVSVSDCKCLVQKFAPRVFPFDAFRQVLSSIDTEIVISGSGFGEGVVSILPLLSYEDSTPITCLSTDVTEENGIDVLTCEIDSVDILFTEIYATVDVGDAGPLSSGSLVQIAEITGDGPSIIESDFSIDPGATELNFFGTNFDLDVNLVSVTIITGETPDPTCDIQTIGYNPSEDTYGISCTVSPPFSLEFPIVEVQAVSNGASTGPPTQVGTVGVGAGNYGDYYNNYYGDDEYYPEMGEEYFPEMGSGGDGPGGPGEPSGPGDTEENYEFTDYYYDFDIPIVTCEGSPGEPCDDANECTVDDRCSPSGVCVGEPKNCDDGSDCTFDACNPGTGECVFYDDCFSDDTCIEAECVGRECIFTTDPECSSDDFFYGFYGGLSAELSFIENYGTEIEDGMLDSIIEGLFYEFGYYYDSFDQPEERPEMLVGAIFTLYDERLPPGQVPSESQVMALSPSYQRLAKGKLLSDTELKDLSTYGISLASGILSSPDLFFNSRDTILEVQEGTDTLIVRSGDLTLNRSDLVALSTNSIESVKQLREAAAKASASKSTPIVSQSTSILLESFYGTSETYSQCTQAVVVGTSGSLINFGGLSTVKYLSDKDPYRPLQPSSNRPGRTYGLSLFDLAGSTIQVPGGAYVLIPVEISDKTQTGYECVFWDDEKMGWDNDGCILDSVVLDEETGLPECGICRCSHTTDFSVLLRGNGGGGEADTIEGLIYIILSASLVGIALLLIIVISLAYHFITPFRKAINSSNKGSRRLSTLKKKRREAELSQMQDDVSGSQSLSV